MNNITDWIKYSLYPSLYESIDRALPEHNFKRHSGGWRSKTYLDSSPHKNREDKTVISKKAIGLILEQGGECLTLIDYVMRRDRIEFIQAVKTLADVIGLQLPKDENFNYQSYQNYRDQITLLEDCNSYFIYCLENSTGAEEVKTYLSSRGYNLEDIKAMELGYIPDQTKLFKYLLNKGYNQSLIDEVVILNKGIGSTHRLTIPYRSGGSIKGFKFRTIGDTTPKYLNSTGLDKLGGFFNLSGIKGDKDVVIVEGELDSLHATIKGVNNVVATGGSSISSEQIKDAIKRGAKSFTLCLDTEPNKEEETINNINSAVGVILDEGVNKVYIVTLPDLKGGKTDPDRFIKERGVDSFKTAINKAIPYSTFRVYNIIKKYGEIEEAKGELTHRDKDNLLTEIVATASTLPPIDKELFITEFLDFEPIRRLGITQETLSITIDKIKATRDKEAQATELKKLLSKATNLHTEGEIAQALNLLESNVKDIRLQDKITEFSSLLIPIKKEDVKKRLSNKPESLNSGYTIGGEELLLPAGAITVLSAPTSHGKTTFLINLALNIAQSYPDKKAYLFSYEEDRDSILINTLNSFLGENISTNNRRTLKTYFTTGATDYITKDKVDLFTRKESRFFTELIDTGRLSINYSSYNSEELIEAIRYLHKNTNIGSVFIDYIQLLNLPAGKYKTYSRQEEIKNICIALKDLAVETGLPIIVGAQFNRTVQNQTHIHPTKISEAGDIERIANTIVGFWNNNLPILHSDGELKEIKEKGLSEPDTLYTILLKNRGGKVNLTELLDFQGNTGKISNKTKVSFEAI
jgi:DNA primase catalytic core